MVLVRVVAGLLFIAVLALLVALWPQGSTSSVSAAPTLPYVLFGRAWTTDGISLGANLSIQARINNVHYAQSVNPSTMIGSANTRTHAPVTSAHYNYGSANNFQVCADDTATSPIEGARTGESVFFFISGIQAQAKRVGLDSGTLASIPFVSGGAQRVDLYIPSLDAAVATPATASDDACETAAASAAATATPTPTATAPPTARTPTMTTMASWTPTT